MTDADTLDTIFSERTPLTACPTSSDDEKQSQTTKPQPQLNFTLLTTILVVTIGSSLQFGYGTGKVVMVNESHSKFTIYPFVGFLKVHLIFMATFFPLGCCWSWQVS
jgi:hypothetical protein